MIGAGEWPKILGVDSSIYKILSLSVNPFRQSGGHRYAIVDVDGPSNEVMGSFELSDIAGTGREGAAWV